MGIATTQMEGAESIGFAVPSAELLRVLPNLARYGSVPRGDLGLSAQPLTPLLARALGVPVRGVLIASVTTDGPAARAGIGPGDIIRAVDGRPVDRPGELARAAADVAPGALARLAVIRRGRARIVLVASRPRPVDPRGAGAVPAASVLDLDP